MNGSEATARIIPALQVRVDEGRLRVIETRLTPVQPRDAVAAVLPASNPLVGEMPWYVIVERVTKETWLLKDGREEITIHAHEVPSEQEYIVYAPGYCIGTLANSATATDNEVADELKLRDAALASTIGAWYRWLMTEVH